MGDLRISEGGLVLLRMLQFWRGVAAVSQMSYKDWIDKAFFSHIHSVDMPENPSPQIHLAVIQAHRQRHRVIVQLHDMD